MSVRDTSARRPYASAGLVALCGFGAYPLALLLHGMVDGVAGAALFMLTMLAGAMVLAAAVSLVLAPRDPRPVRRSRAPRVARCRSCRRIREVRHDVWICLNCDQTAAVTQPR